MKSKKPITGDRRLFLGRSGAGKTYLLTHMLIDILSKIPKNKRVLYIFSPTVYVNEDMKKLAKFANGKATTINDELVETLRRKLNQAKNKHKFVVFDDMGANVYLKYQKKNNWINDLIIQSRNLNVHLYFAFQKYTQSTNDLRDCADLIYLFKSDNIDEMKKVNKEFCGFIEWKNFSEMLHQCWSKRWGYLLIDRRDSHQNKYYCKRKRIKLQTEFH